MFITKIVRTYSKSINLKSYGLAESWIKIESSIEAAVESQDDPTQISIAVYNQAKKEVIDAANDVVKMIRDSQAPKPVPVSAPIQPIAPAPVQPVAPAPVYQTPPPAPAPVQTERIDL